VASLGHVVVGIAASRAYRTAGATRWSAFGAAVVWSGLSLLPDADVVGMRFFGVRYGDPWGHRGATHSVVFALVIGVVAALVARAAKLPVVRTWLFATLVVVSHGLLDTLTDGGLGVALLWPFSAHRYFAPWTPIPVAPIGARLATREGLRVMGIELVMFAPLLVWGLWPRRKQSSAAT